MMGTLGTGLDQLFEASFAAQLVIEPASGRILRANAAASALYGLSNDGLRTLCLADLVTADMDKQPVILRQQTAA
jgi:hypothetical protein